MDTETQRKEIIMNNEDELLVQMIKEHTGKEAFKCCICGGFFYGYGNNPYPVVEDEDARCCDACDSTVVISARIEQMYGKKN